MKILSQEDVRQQSLPLQQFAQLMGYEVDYYALRRLFWRLGEGDFQSLPLVCICSRERLNGAPSAYAASEDAILLAEDFVSACSESQIVALLVQEIVNSLAERAICPEDSSIEPYYPHVDISDNSRSFARPPDEAL